MNKFLTNICVASLKGAINVLDVSSNILAKPEETVPKIELDNQNQVILSLILEGRSEMQEYLDAEPEDKKLLRNYILGRIRSYDDLLKKMGKLK